jgi:SAM-dependent methyltransferase
MQEATHAHRTAPPHGHASVDTGPRAGRRIPAALAAITLGTAIACACGGAHERVAHGGNSGGASSRDDRVASDAAGDVGGGAPVHAGHPHRAHGHGGGRDRVGHDAWSAEEYARRLESPDRDRWQQPQALVEALGITAGQRVAEVGAGSGYLLPYLSRAVGPSGRVLAEDVRDDLLALARARVARDSLGNVETRLGAFDDPRLEAGAYDLVLMVDVYHHIEERGPFLARVAAALARGGRLVIVDFRDGDRRRGTNCRARRSSARCAWPASSSRARTTSCPTSSCSSWSPARSSGRRPRPSSRAALPTGGHAARRSSGHAWCSTTT